MYKQVIVTLSVIVASCALGALAIDDACTADAIVYLKSFQMNPSIQVLIDEQRRFYPDFEKIHDHQLNKEFAAAMIAIGPQQGCKELSEHIQQLGGAQVPCFSARRDANGLSELAKSDETIKSMLEGLYACMVSEMRIEFG